MFSTSPTAYLQQKKTPLNDDDIVNEESEYLSGLIEFHYTEYKRKYYKSEGRFDKDELEYSLKTHDEIDFQAGDRVRVLDKWHTIIDVATITEERHNPFLALNPNALERLSIKELRLK